MKLIIDIPEETFTCLKNMIEAECVDPYSLADIIVNKGTPVSTEGDLISRSALKDYAFEVYQGNGVELKTLMVVPLCEIDNAPPEITNEDLQNAMTESFKNGYEMAKAKYERPQFCPNCGADMRGKKNEENTNII